MRGPTKTIGIVGAGVIGSGWTARCVARGLHVIATDPSPEAEDRWRASVENAWPALEQLGFSHEKAGGMAFTLDSDELCAKADFIQESVPDNLELKCAVHRRLDAATAPEVVIVSSSSGLLPSRIQAGCRHPERIVIAHPFNPVYILPLVEVLGGEQTSDVSIDAALAFYRSLDMHTLRVRTEIEGYIADRLLEALWREALHLIADGVATTEEIDAAITYGPGLRWSVMGVCLTYHLAGGPGGMGHFLEHFGPALKLPWTHLKAPDLTDELVQRMVTGTAEQSAGRSVQELERLRDDCLVSIMRTLQQHDVGAGKTLLDTDNQNG